LFILIRALTYATFFVGILLWFAPAQILSASGLRAPATFGVSQAIGSALGAVGMILGAICILMFVFAGKGTQAPFDPPRRLVARGPYKVVRNPMYLSAGFVLAGFALFYRSIGIAVYMAVFMLAAHAFVVFYEEPTLSRMFAGDYADYRRRVGRWWPRLS
jgi:protein-S-isoprenylcysteine O-methyltransferase Ste14